MQIVSFFNKHKAKVITIIQILIFPIVMILIDILVRTILNMGTYFGTFLRNLYELVV